MEYSQIKELFRKYLSGQAGNDEQKSIEQWYDKLEKRDPVQLSAAAEKALEADIWQKLEPRLLKKRKPRRLYTYVGVAASITLIVFAGFFFMTRNKGKADQAPRYQDYYTGIGERKKLTLEDGTAIALNSASRLRIYLDVTVSRRVDIIDGEVFLDVHHDPAHPFIIRSGNVTTQVLGTSLNIRAYKNMEDISISVLEGKVQVSDSIHTLGILEKQQKLVFNQQDKTYAIQASNGDVIAWQNGKLLFKNTSFEEMALLMQKNYGIYLKSADERVKQKKFTASLPLSLSALKAAEVLASIHQFKIKQRRDTIELYR